MSSDHLKLGLKGEALAIAFLIKKGYIILELRYKNTIGEIDIIAKDKGVICFIEVKSRSSLAYGKPLEAVTYFKQRKIIQVAQCYLLNRFKSVDIACRFDVVSIVGGINNPEIEYIPNAFELC